MADVLDVDGSLLEGGGQILRMSVAFSAIMGIPVRVSKIRLGRSKPGLAAQHLKGLQLVAEMCRAKLTGAQVGSTEIEFRPGKLLGGRYIADTQTAGSISLLLQIALPCALLADNPTTLVLKGGTNAEMAPQVDYMSEIFRPNLEKFGATFDFDLLRRGYFPRGGGQVEVLVKPVKSFRSVSLLQRGTIDKVFGWSFVAGTLPIKLAHEMRDAARRALGSAVSCPVDVDCYKESRDVAPDNCSGIVLGCESSEGCVLGADGLGKRGVDAYSVGKSAGEQLRDTVRCGACLDAHSQDQVILFMALACGRSSVRVGDVTLHTKTAIHIAELLTKCKFNITPDGSTNVIECEGIGFVNKNLTV